ncbi:MAG: helix-turn-helix domain-containing protein, partial [Clostridia bacterium]|nr:helix-turn-helix domain-containing protein [Clostridia bacterium]
MDYITVKEAAERWQVSERRVQILCNTDRIKGAYRFGKSYMIPENAEYPKRRKKNDSNSVKLPMPKKSPFLDMTDLYTKAGTAEKVIESLAEIPEAQA